MTTKEDPDNSDTDLEQEAEQYCRCRSCGRPDPSGLCEDCEKE